MYALSAIVKAQIILDYRQAIVRCAIATGLLIEEIVNNNSVAICGAAKIRIVD